MAAGAGKPPPRARWRHRIELYLIAAYCLGMMLVYATAVTNIGALYRFRYGFIVTLGALGVAAGLGAWRGVQTAAKRDQLGIERSPGRAPAPTARGNDS